MNAVKENILENITQAIGKTPLVRLNRFSAGLHAEIIVKLESFNPLNSVKCRIGKAMIDDAVAKGSLKPNGTVIEPTSGNTGIGLAYVCAALGYRLILVMPESMSVERRKLVKMLGAELVLTPATEGMTGAVRKAKELSQKTPNSFVPMQFENPANPRVHSQSTAEEIWEALEGRFDYFVAGVGTGGTITGCGSVFKQRNKAIKIVAVEPDASPVLSGGKPGPHRIQGIGAGFIPKILNRDILDEVIPVSISNSISTAQSLGTTEGILCGISSGAALFAALSLARRPETIGKRIVAILPDSGERYLSTPLSNLTG